jgi:8-oxo-dGTP pyrophosphatase MutT (NUDIX family)
MTSSLREPYREVAAAILVGTCGRLLFQQRDDVPGILFPGQVGLFGGHREGSETPIECALREIAEETGLELAPDRLEPLVELTAAYPAGGGVRGNFYVVRNVPIGDIVVTEGSALVIEASALPALLPRLTPSACYVARLFLEAARTAAG